MKWRSSSVTGDGTVTRTVYVRGVADARRRALRRSRVTTEYAGALKAALEIGPQK